MKNSKSLNESSKKLITFKKEPQLLLSYISDKATINSCSESSVIEDLLLSKICQGSEKNNLVREYIRDIYNPQIGLKIVLMRIAQHFALPVSNKKHAFEFLKLIERILNHPASKIDTYYKYLTEHFAKNNTIIKRVLMDQKGKNNINMNTKKLPWEDVLIILDQIVEPENLFMHWNYILILEDYYRELGNTCSAYYSAIYDIIALSDASFFENAEMRIDAIDVIVSCCQTMIYDE